MGYLANQPGTELTLEEQIALYELSNLGNANQILAVNSTGTGLIYINNTSTDEKVKYNASDLLAGYLADKIIAGTGITLSEGTGADADKLKITNSLDISGKLNIDQTTPQTTTGTFTFPKVLVNTTDDGINDFQVGGGSRFTQGFISYSDAGTPIQGTMNSINTNNLLFRLTDSNAQTYLGTNSYFDFRSNKGGYMGDDGGFTFRAGDGTESINFDGSFMRFGTSQLGYDTATTGNALFCGGDLTFSDDGINTVQINGTSISNGYFIDVGVPDDSTGKMRVGFIPDFNTLPIVDFGINASQFGHVNTDYQGGIFRLDMRDGAPFFQILRQDTGGTNETVPFMITKTNNVLVGEAWCMLAMENTGDGSNAALQSTGFFFSYPSASFTDGNVLINTAGVNDTINSLQIGGNIKLITDSDKAIFGAGSDMSIYYNGTNGYIKTDDIAPSDLHISCGTDKTLILDTPVYNDIYTQIASAKIPASAYPDWTAFTANTNAYTFKIDDYADLGTMEILHGYKEGTDLEVHLHLATNGTNNGTARKVKYIVYYTWGVPDNGSNQFSAEGSLTAELTIPANQLDKSTYYLSMGTISGTGLKIGTQLKTRIKRIAGTGTEPINDPFLGMVGVHYQVDSVGSRTLGVK